MRRLISTLFLRFLSVFLLAAVVYSGWLAYAILVPLDAAGSSQRLTIIPGQSVRDISHILAEHKVIRDPFAFELYARVMGFAGSIQAGIYTVSPSYSVPALAKALGAPTGVAEKEITIIEGWTINDIGVYLEKQGIVTRDDFSQALNGLDRKDYPFLGPETKDSLEGYLFPDTYRIFDKATAGDVIKKMLDNFGGKIDPDMAAKARESGHSLHEVVTLASILEHEVQTEEDKAIVADIFYRRIAAGMRLQSDATVNYVTGKSELQPSSDDLTVDSHYNTYKYDGLPPGPIGNPGMSSIRAALMPKKNDYLFFLTTKDNQVIYSKTYDEHLANKRKYLSAPDDANGDNTPKTDTPTSTDTPKQ